MLDSRRSRKEMVTLSTFGTWDRLSAFDRVDRNWPGPKVLVVFFEDYQSQPVPVSVQIPELEERARGWSNVKVVYYYARRQDDEALFSPWSVFNDSGSYKPMIPVNSLRNLAVDLAETELVFPVDIDFYPSVTAYNQLERLSYDANLPEKFAFLVPHFEFRSCFVEVQKSRNQNLVYPNDFESFHDNFTRDLVSSGATPGSPKSVKDM